MNEATDTTSHGTSGDDDKHHERKSPDSIEREVDQARARVGRTFGELSERFSVGDLLDQALGMAREHGGDLGRRLGSQVRENPMPVILTSVGIAWMILSSRTNGAAHGHGTYGTGTDKHGSSSTDSSGDTASKSRDKAAAVGGRVQGATANLKESAQNARESLVQFYREQPLLAGSLGIAVGAALGALVPPTDMEDDMFGEASDRSVEAAKSKAVEQHDEVRDSVRAE